MILFCWTIFNDINVIDNSITISLKFYYDTHINLLILSYLIYLTVDNWWLYILLFAVKGNNYINILNWYFLKPWNTWRLIWNHKLYYFILFILCLFFFNWWEKANKYNHKLQIHIDINMQKDTQVLLFKEQNKNKYVKISKTITKERKVKWEKALERKNQMECSRYTKAKPY